MASLVSPGHDGKLYVSALTPLLLWMIVRAVRDGRLWAFGMIAVTTGLMIVSPHYQLMYYAGFMAVAFTLYLALRKSDEPLERGHDLTYSTSCATSERKCSAPPKRCGSISSTNTQLPFLG